MKIMPASQCRNITVPGRGEGVVCVCGGGGVEVACGGCVGGMCVCVCACVCVCVCVCECVIAL